MAHRRPSRTPQALSSLALCTIEGDRDNITGAGQTHAAHTLCGAMPGSRRATITITDCDHYGLFSGRRWRDAIHPALTQFWNSVPVPRSVPSSIRRIAQPGRRYSSTST
ncbi:hypothetical protein [Paraburkholderia sp. LEh10]|uniref:hypothetical protein n=1 Tax=Paraburkholderia sp. LEh10 TaxID=2821353 RepID=UPI0028AD89F2|nr:hypothetical protein [Paraburkholderia sp. LEh10]